MNITEARELLDVGADADMKEILAANDIIIERSLGTSNLTLYRKGLRAVAALLVARKHMTQTSADDYVSFQDDYVTKIGPSLDQGLADIRESEQLLHEHRSLESGREPNEIGLEEATRAVLDARLQEHQEQHLARVERFKNFFRKVLVIYSQRK